MKHEHTVPGTGGEKYVPYDQRNGKESVVYFTRDLSADGLQKIFQRISCHLQGKVGVKLHTGEKNGPNIIPRSWVEQLLKQELPEAAIIETNSY